MKQSPVYSADSVIAATGATLTAQVTARTAGLLRGIALAWLLPSAEFGLLGAALVLLNTLVPLANVGLFEGIARYVPFHQAQGTARLFVRTSVALVVALSFCAAAVFWALSPWIVRPLLGVAQSGTTVRQAEAISGNGQRVMFAVGCCLFVLPVYHAVLGVFRGLRLFRFAGLAEAGAAVLFTAVAVSVAWLGWDRAAAVLLCYAVGCGVVALPAFAYVGRILGVIERGQSAPPNQAASQVTTQAGARPRGYVTSLLSYSAWTAATALLMNAMLLVPMRLVMNRGGADVAASFYAILMICQIVHAGGVLLAFVASADVMYAWEHDAREEALRRMELLTRAIAVILLCAGIVLGLAKPLVFKVFPAAFLVGYAGFEPLLVCFLMTAFLVLVGIRLNVVERPRYVTWSWAVGLAATIAAGYLLLNRDSVASAETVIVLAAWAAAVGSALALACCLALAHRARIPCGWRAIVLMTMAGAIGLGPAGCATVGAALALGLWFSGVFFTGEERDRIQERIKRLFGTS